MREINLMKFDTLKYIRVFLEIILRYKQALFPSKVL